ncbi:bis(5'-adenosyl)-triphosphatase ENPP4 [Hydra vulgaris]|uniref:bis(5'-adenosyl)-triphosphatase ENPP4 n=1 Tax=Hydra vulgaris TaxID=6087 RepID=UPI00019258A1|nr:bis(5'-adenosyl)-triphosphatase ENPP4-like [Hydra vulgaris]
MLQPKKTFFVFLCAIYFCDATSIRFVSNEKFRDFEDNNKKLERSNNSVHSYHYKIEENEVFNNNKSDWQFKGFNINNNYILDKKPASVSILHKHQSTQRKCHQNNRFISNHLIEKPKREKQKILLISIDGLRWNYLNKAHTPNLKRIIKEGVSVDFVLNVFPTLSLPNHQSIVTGLYPEHHEMISYTMRDSKSGQDFDGTSEWWNKSIPIWISNQKQGYQSGISFWPGYRVKYDGMQPFYLPDKMPDQKFNTSSENNDKFNTTSENNDKFNNKLMPINERIKQAVNWLKNDNVTFVALYIETVDKVTHTTSPDSDKKNMKTSIEKAIVSVDRNLGFVRKLLVKNNLQSLVNVIVIGDHGSVDANYTQMIVLDEYLNVEKNIEHIDGVTSVFVTTKSKKKQHVYEILKKKSKTKNSHFQVYLKENIPEFFHIKNSNRIGDILILPKPGWTVVAKKWMPSYYKGQWSRGENGYSNIEATMNPAFFAYGPSFRVGYKQWCVKTIDIYSLMCHILNINPEFHDGCFERVKPFLKEFRGEKYIQVNDKFDPIIC